MGNCGAKWQVKIVVEGLLMDKWRISTVAICKKKFDHDGKHFARIRSNVDDTVADIEW